MANQHSSTFEDINLSGNDELLKAMKIFCPFDLGKRYQTLAHNESDEPLFFYF